MKDSQERGAGSDEKVLLEARLLGGKVVPPQVRMQLSRNTVLEKC